MVRDGSAEFIKDQISRYQDQGRQSETNDAVPHEFKELGHEITFDSPFTAPFMNVYVVRSDFRSAAWPSDVMKGQHDLF